jgi:hypothetical protein
MRHALVGLAVSVLMLATAAPADAWGFTGHRLITRRALELLPPELKPFFEKYKDEIVMRSVDPDLWRNIGWEDDPNHFLDFGAPEYGAFPFAALPREYDLAVEKFGVDVVRRNGMLPWRFSEEFGRLRRDFEEFTRPAPYTVGNVVLFAAIAAHYIEDAHQPFHATINYDGRATGNDGIHSRFERDLIERFESRLRLTPPPLKTFATPRDVAFDTLLASYQLVDPILAADKEAAAGRDTYDDAYYEAFFVKVQPILEKRLSDAISAVASAIVSAWEEAGRRTPRLVDARPPQRIRR